jgi:hypothetical protein
MATTILAHFDGQFFVPDEPVAELRPGDRVEVVLAPKTDVPALEAKDWRKTLRHAIDLHPNVTHFVDDSRDSIYAGRGE